jgi:hypothetical protein
MVRFEVGETFTTTERVSESEFPGEFVTVKDAVVVVIVLYVTR